MVGKREGQAGEEGEVKGREVKGGRGGGGKKRCPGDRWRSRLRPQRNRQMGNETNQGPESMTARDREDRQAKNVRAKA